MSWRSGRGHGHRGVGAGARRRRYRLDEALDPRAAVALARRRTRRRTGRRAACAHHACRGRRPVRARVGHVEGAAACRPAPERRRLSSSMPLTLRFRARAARGAPPSRRPPSTLEGTGKRAVAAHGHVHEALRRSSQSGPAGRRRIALAPASSSSTPRGRSRPRGRAPRSRAPRVRGPRAGPPPARPRPGRSRSTTTMSGRAATASMRASSSRVATCRSTSARHSSVSPSSASRSACVQIRAARHHVRVLTAPAPRSQAAVVGVAGHAPVAARREADRADLRARRASPSA